MANAHNGHSGPCPNCEHELAAEDKFCPNCGQQNHDLKIPLGHLLYELIEGLFHFDGKFFRTFATIFTRPGKVVVDFLDGKRARYVPPVRLYIFVSILFFFLVHKCTEKVLDDNFSVNSTNGNTKLNPSEAKYKPQEKGKPEEKYYDKEEVSEGYTKKTDNDGEVSFGVKAISKKGIIVSSGSEELDMRFYRLAWAGIPVTDRVLPQDSMSSAGFKKHVFMQEMQRQMLNQPDTAAGKHWARNLIRTLEYYDESLNNQNSDTLFIARNEQGQRVLKYQPRMQYLPTDSASMQSYLSIHSKAEVDSLFRHYHQEPGIMKRVGFDRVMFLYRAALNNRVGNVWREYWMPVFFKYISLAMFLLMPAAGFFLLIFFFMRRKYYYEHLVFSIYTHSTVFLLFSLSILIEMAFAGSRLETAADWFTSLLIVSVFPYFILSLRRVYRQEWGITLLKSFFLFGIYSVFLLLLTIGIFVVSFVTF